VCARDCRCACAVRVIEWGSYQADEQAAVVRAIKSEYIFLLEYIQVLDVGPSGFPKNSAYDDQHER